MKFKRFFPRPQLARDSLVKKLIPIGFLFLFLQFSLALVFFRHLPSVVPLFYSQAWGEAQLAKKTTFWLLPFLTTVVFMLNLAFAHFVFAAEKIVSEILIVAAVVFAFLILLTQIKIILLFW